MVAVVGFTGCGGVVLVVWCYRLPEFVSVVTGLYLASEYYTTYYSVYDVVHYAVLVLF